MLLVQRRMDFATSRLPKEVREGYVTYLGELLLKNYDSVKLIDPPDQPLSPEALNQASLELEYQAFSTNTASNLYRRSIAKVMADIRKSTKEMSLYSFLKYFEYTPQEKTKDVDFEKRLYKKDRGESSDRSKKPTKKYSNSIIPASQLVGSSLLAPKRSKGMKRESLFQSAIEKYMEKNKKQSDEHEEAEKLSKKSDDECSNEDIDPDFTSVLDSVPVNNEKNDGSEEDEVDPDFAACLQSLPESFSDGGSSNKGDAGSSFVGFQKSSLLFAQQESSQTGDNKEVPDRVKLNSLRARYFGFENPFNENSNAKCKMELENETDSQQNYRTNEGYEDEKCSGGTENVMNVSEDEIEITNSEHEFIMNEINALNSTKKFHVKPEKSDMPGCTTHSIKEIQISKDADDERLLFGSKNWDGNYFKTDEKTSDCKIKGNIDDILSNDDQHTSPVEIINDSEGENRKSKTSGNSVCVNNKWNDLFSFNGGDSLKSCSNSPKSSTSSYSRRRSEKSRSKPKNKDIVSNEQSIKSFTSPSSVNDNTNVKAVDEIIIKKKLKRKCVELFGDSDEEINEGIESKRQNNSKLENSPVSEKLNSTVFIKLKDKKRLDPITEFDRVEKQPVIDSHTENKTNVVLPEDRKSSSNSCFSKKELSDAVIKYLMPFYKQQKIVSKDLFKYIARTLVHKALDNKSIERVNCLKKMVHNLFLTVDLFDSEDRVNEALKT